MSKPVIITDADECVRVNIRDLSCPICFEVKTDLLTPRCGHAVCAGCYAGMARHDRVAGPACPTCKQPGTFVPNAFASAIAGRVAVRCPHECGAPNITIQSFPDHERGCPRLSMTCPHAVCKWAGVRADYAKHADECAEAIVKCTHCSAMLHRGALVMHMAACPYAIQACDKCRDRVAKWRMPQHKCEPACKSCQFRPYETTANATANNRIQCVDCTRWRSVDQCGTCSHIAGRRTRTRAGLRTVTAAFCTVCQHYASLASMPQDDPKACPGCSMRPEQRHGRMPARHGALARHCNTCDEWSVLAD